MEEKTNATVREVIEIESEEVDGLKVSKDLHERVDHAEALAALYCAAGVLGKTVHMVQNNELSADYGLFSAQQYGDFEHKCGEADRSIFNYQIQVKIDSNTKQPVGFFFQPVFYTLNE